MVYSLILLLTLASRTLLPLDTRLSSSHYFIALTPLDRGPLYLSWAVLPLFSSFCFLMCSWDIYTSIITFNLLPNLIIIAYLSVSHKSTSIICFPSSICYHLHDYLYTMYLLAIIYLSLYLSKTQTSVHRILDSIIKSVLVNHTIVMTILVFLTLRYHYVSKRFDCTVNH